MANALSYERIAAIRRTLDDIEAGGVLREVLQDISRVAYAWTPNLEYCLEKCVRTTVADARKQDAAPRPDLDILEHILSVPLYFDPDDNHNNETSVRALAIADVALALYRLYDHARE